MFENIYYISSVFLGALFSPVNHWIHVFLNVSAMWNANSLIQDLNSGCYGHI